MTTLERLDADDLRQVVIGFRDALRLHQEAINRLNVYPVPDGDTGTNMALTLESVVQELDGVSSDMAAVAKAIGYGSLMGARGNSGVILSQILRGFTPPWPTSTTWAAPIWPGPGPRVRRPPQGGRNPVEAPSHRRAGRVQGPVGLRQGGALLPVQVVKAPSPMAKSPCPPPELFPF